MKPTHQVSLISRWFVKPGCHEAAMRALTKAARDVEAKEPGTLTYRIHVQRRGHEKDLQSLPPEDPLSILFFEVYRDADAFEHHLHGKVFTAFVRDHGDLFTGAGGKPFTTVNFLTLHAGFSRAEDQAVVNGKGPAAAMEGEPANRHPAVMFEIIASDQSAARDFYSEVFGWNYQTGSDGFSYIHFPAGSPPLLGGIGKAQPDTPGFAPGHNFYLLVDDLQCVLDRAVAAGATALMQPTQVDGYNFAMFTDREGNPIGLIEPFAGQAGTSSARERSQ
jgi:predicted enzyme related to lactoylglutathione lyase/quinol monooxygenase YgiN